MCASLDESFGQREAEPTTSTCDDEDSAIDLEFWKAVILGFGLRVSLSKGRECLIVAESLKSRETLGNLKWRGMVRAVEDAEELQAVRRMGCSQRPRGRTNKS